VAVALVAVNLPFLLLNGLSYAPFLGSPESLGLRLYVGAAFLLHFLFLSALILGPLWLATRGKWGRWVGPILAPALLGVLQAFIFIDARIYSSFQMHATGFILEVILQDDAFKVLGLQRGEVIAFVAALLAIALGEFGAWALLRRLLPRWRGGALLHAAPRARWIAIGAAGFVLLLVLEKVAFAVHYHLGRMEATLQARCLPFYVPLTMGRFLRRVSPETAASFAVARPPAVRTRLNYPKAPIVPTGRERRLNVVWIAVEAWRPDFLTPEIMPVTHRFGEGCLRGTRHLSGGNATRFGLFSMFYGLHAAMYDHFRQERRGPVLLDLLKRTGYEMKVWGSAELKFLGPRETVFVDVQDALEDGFHEDGAVSDRIMTDRFLSWIDGRPEGKSPFFAFLFYDAPHPRFYFEPQFGRFTPYLEDLSNIDRRADQRDLVLNRYRNSLVNVDFHLGRVFEALARRGLLDDTLVLITGDHGEEFWEHGHFSHSSGFTEQQLAVPLLLRGPGVSPGELRRLTSHLDLPATVLDLLGFQADPSAYSQGRSLLGPAVREFAVASGWKDHAYIDNDVKIAFLSANVGLSLWSVTDSNDNPVSDSRAWLKRKSVPLLACFRHLHEFTAAPQR
jgi:hypothetical protein